MECGTNNILHLAEQRTVYAAVKTSPGVKILEAAMSRCVIEDGGRGDRLLP